VSVRRGDGDGPRRPWPEHGGYGGDPVGLVLLDRAQVRFRGDAHCHLVWPVQEPPGPALHRPPSSTVNGTVARQWALP
jgi:hypothetical protein